MIVSVSRSLLPSSRCVLVFPFVCARLLPTRLLPTLSTSCVPVILSWTWYVVVRLVSGKSIDLRPKEFLLLEYLVRNANRPVTRTMILEHVWNSSFEGLTNVVDVYISALRTKLDRGFPQKLIQTNRGIGYTLTSPPLPSVTARRPPTLSMGHSEAS